MYQPLTPQQKEVLRESDQDISWTENKKAEDREVEQLILVIYQF